MSYFYTFKLCNYLLMANQQYITYISDINNIINNEKKLGGAFENMNNAANISGALRDRTSSLPKGNPQELWKQLKANKKPPMGMPGMPPMGMSKPPMGMPGMPPMGMPGMPPMGMSGMPPMGMPGAPPMGMSGAPPTGMPGAPPSGKETNSQLKNMVKGKSDFEEYINKIDGYIQMLGSCKKGEIKEFIEKNNNSQQQISNNAVIENDLTNQQLNNKEELSNVQKEKDDIKEKSDNELKKAHDDLDEHKKEETELKGRFEKLTKEKEKLEADLETAKATAAKNDTPSNDADAANLQKKLDELIKTEKEAKIILEKEKAEIKQKYDAILNQQEESTKKMKATEEKAQKLEVTMAKNKNTIENLQKENIKIISDNEEGLKNQEAILAEREARIKEIQAKLDGQNKNTQGEGQKNTDDIDNIKKAKDELEFEQVKLRNLLSNAEKKEKEQSIELNNMKEEKKKMEKELQDAKDAATKNGIPVNNDQTNALNSKLKDLEAQLQQKVEEKKAEDGENIKKTNQMNKLNAKIKENEIILEERDVIIKKNQNELKEMANIRDTLEAAKVTLEQEKAELQQTNATNADFKRQLDAMQGTNTSLQNKLDEITAKEKTYNQTLEELRKNNATDKQAISVAQEKETALKQQFDKEKILLKQEIDELKKKPVQIPQPQNISGNNYNDTYRYSGFTLSFPSTSRSEYIELKKDSSNSRVKLCTNSVFVSDQNKNIQNYNYVINNAGRKKIVVTGVNNYKLKYSLRRIDVIPGDDRYLSNNPSNNISANITPQKITPEQFTILLQKTDSNNCIKLEFTELNDDNSVLEHRDNPKIVYVIPLSLNNHPNQNLIRGGGSTTNVEDNEQVLSMTKFKEIKESVDNIIIKVKEYEKKLLKEKRGNIKYKTKLLKIKELIEISKKINKIYEGTTMDKVKNTFSSIGTGVKNTFSNIGRSKLGKNIKGGSALKPARSSASIYKAINKGAPSLILPGDLPQIPILSKSEAVERDKKAQEHRKNKEEEELDNKNKDKNSKKLTKKKCMKLVKYLENFNEILKNLQSDTGDANLEEIKTDAANVKIKTDSGKNELIDKMMGVQNSFNPTSSDGKPNNSTEILTKTTMIIYDILLISIVIICIIIYILFVINIIKFLYQCFLEVGNSQHNNLSTGSTLRYKLLGYVVYINNCNLPGLFSSFNSVDSPSGTFMKLSKVLEQYFTNKQSTPDDDTFESIFGELADKVAIPKTPEEKAEEKQNKWLKEEGKDETLEKQEEHKEKLMKEEIENDQERKNTQYEENKNYKEPKFNIFLCIRLVFICIKLFITFITIIVVSIITFILLSVVSQMANMDAIEIQIIKKQKLFFMLLKLLVVSIIHLFIKLIIYKTIFVKIYNKYLNTYLNIIAIDLKINSLKKSDDLEYIDSDLAKKLKTSIDNDSNIEERLIQLMNQDGVDNVANETIVKNITIYMLLKYLYSYDKNKSKYLLYYSYFINDGDYSFPSELNMEKNNITTFYSLIPNKHRKTPINYFKYSDIKNISDIEKAEKIRQDVNTNISQINTYIAEANSYFDDDNFIVSLGWYILINIILGTIYIIIIVTIILKETGIMNSEFNLEEFIRFE